MKKKLYYYGGNVIVTGGKLGHKYIPLEKNDEEIYFISKKAQPSIGQKILVTHKSNGTFTSEYQKDFVDEKLIIAARAKSSYEKENYKDNKEYEKARKLAKEKDKLENLSLKELRELSKKHGYIRPFINLYMR